MQDDVCSSSKSSITQLCVTRCDTAQSGRNAFVYFLLLSNLSTIFESSVRVVCSSRLFVRIFSVLKLVLRITQLFVQTTYVTILKKHRV